MRVKCKKFFSVYPNLLLFGLFVINISTKPHWDFLLIRPENCQRSGKEKSHKTNLKASSGFEGSPLQLETFYKKKEVNFVKNIYQV